MINLAFGETGHDAEIAGENSFLPRADGLRWLVVDL